MALDFTQQVAQLIESQFPEVFRDEGENLVAFITAYYEFLESDDLYSHKLGRGVFEIADIDTSLEKFLYHFKETYLAEFPYVFETDKRFAIKHIAEFYRTKGSKKSLELLMRMLFNESVDVYYPGEDVLRLSDSVWYKPSYLEVTKSPRTSGFINKEVTGVKSGAKAFVESVVRKRVKGKVFDVLYLSALRGNFETGEIISDDGSIADAPKVKGSLSEVEISLGGRNNSVGDIFSVVTPEGLQGKVKVSEVRAATGRVDFSIVNGGWGYTADGFTDVYISDAIAFANNTNSDFILYESVYQPLEKISVISAATVLANTSLIGNHMTGRNGVSLVANGIVVAVANTNANGDIISTASSNGIITVQTNFGTFRDQRTVNLNLSGTAAFAVGEYVTEESQFNIGGTSATGTFTVGEKAEQIIREPISNLIVSYGFGTVVSSNSTAVTLRPAWGVINTTTPAVLRGATSNATIVPTSLVVPNANTGARGRVSSISGNSAIIDVSFGTFDTGNQVRGDSTRKIYTITGSSQSGATTVYLQNQNSTNGTITTTQDSFVRGIVVGQNTTSVGVFGNTIPFITSNSFSTYLYTEREKLISPPRYANGAIINVVKVVNRFAGGAGANFDIGAVEDVEENVTVYSDIIGANNVVGIPYVNISLNGRGSGVGYLQSMTIDTGGTGYANNARVAFLGGGYANGDPLVFANAYITTNGSGVITTITVDVNGEGYFDNPVVQLPATGGTVATVTPVMDYGYGFPKNPNAELGNLIGDVLDTQVMDIGKISLLSAINPGAEYTADPFVSVRNRYTAAYQRRDIVVTANGAVGSFAVGEEVVQTIGAVTSIKGIVKSTQVVGSNLMVYLERNRVGVSFNSAYPIIGYTTGATANIVSVEQDETTNVIGENAVISATAISANGIATKVEVIDSGFGYINDDEVTLQRDGNPFVITGTSLNIRQGISEGYWRTTTSHLNSEKKIHDNKYYQEYSYDVLSGLSLNRYEQIVKKALHVSGTRMFGSVVKSSDVAAEPVVFSTAVVTSNNVFVDGLWSDTGLWVDEVSLS
jgi:hypothetical protein